MKTSTLTTYSWSSSNDNLLSTRRIYGWLILSSNCSWVGGSILTIGNSSRFLVLSGVRWSREDGIRRLGSSVYTYMERCPPGRSLSRDAVVCKVENVRRRRWRTVELIQKTCHKRKESRRKEEREMKRGEMKNVLYRRIVPCERTVRNVRVDLGKYGNVLVRQHNCPEIDVSPTPEGCVRTSCVSANLRLVFPVSRLLFVGSWEWWEYNVISNCQSWERTESY